MTTQESLAVTVMELLRDATNGGAVPAISVAVLQGNNPILVSSHGKASLELGVDATPETVFPVASITKVVTAILTMQAIQGGRLSPDDCLATLLPGLPQSWGAPTVREAMAHVSGLPDVIVDPIGGKWLAETREGALAAAGALPLQFPAGSAWSYNQTNYVLLGWLLELAYGTSFDDIVKERILQPLSLSSTCFGDSTAVVSRRGPWYSRIDFSGPEPRLATEVHQMWVTYPTFAHPCAGLNTTALELARLVSAVASAELVSAEMRDEMWAVHTMRDGSPAHADPETAFALGWMVENLNGHTLVGGTGGASCAFRHAVAEETTVVVLTNCQGANPDGIASTVMSLALAA